MSAEEFMERTSDAEVRILASLVFSRDGKGDPSVRRAEMIRDLKALMGTEEKRRDAPGSLRDAGSGPDPGEGGRRERLSPRPAAEDIRILRHRPQRLEGVPPRVDRRHRQEIYNLKIM